MLLNGILVKKLNAGWGCRKTGSENCDCKGKTCVWRGGCRSKNIVYKITCKECGKFYIGATQNKAKIRMNQHYSGVKKLLEKNVKSTKFSKHFSRCYIKRYGTKKYNVNKIRDMCHHEVVYEANPLVAVKTYGGNACRLCMVERMEILKESCRNQRKLLNRRSEIFSTCRHNVYFHQYVRHTEELTRRGEKEFCQECL